MNKATKLISVDKAVRLIKDGNTIAVGGFVGCGNPEELTVAIEKNYIAENKPAPSSNRKSPAFSELKCPAMAVESRTTPNAETIIATKLV